MKRELTELLPALRRFSWSLTNAEHDADDLLQMTVERLLSKGVPDDASLKAWAFTVCRNLWIDEYRARKVRQNAESDPMLNNNLKVDGEKAVLSQLELERVDQAMQTLPDEQHLVLSMIAVQGLSYRAAAETLGIPIGTVMSRLARARTRLADILELGNADIQTGEIS